MSEKFLPILCVDFDGVIHSYSSGWMGPRVIPDPPVDGALEFLIKALNSFEVCIFSSRSRYLFGRYAIKSWLKNQYISLARTWESTPLWLRDYISRTAFADPWEYEVDYSVRCLVKEFSFPTEKPPAHIQIDDRALTFTGVFPDIEDLKKYVPWNFRQKLSVTREICGGKTIFKCSLNNIAVMKTMLFVCGKEFFLDELIDFLNRFGFQDYGCIRNDEMVGKLVDVGVLFKDDVGVISRGVLFDDFCLFVNNLVKEKEKENECFGI